MGRVTLVIAATVLLAIVFVAARSMFLAPSPSPSPPPTQTAVVRPTTAAPTSTSTPTSVPTASPTPAPLVSERGNIIMEQPQANARVSSGFTVSGRARAFEGAIAWRLVDVGGAELTKGFTTASIGAPEFGTYSFPVAYRVTAQANGFVEVFTRSPRDGSIDEIVRVPLVLLP